MSVWRKHRTIGFFILFCGSLTLGSCGGNDGNQASSTPKAFTANEVAKLSSSEAQNEGHFGISVSMSEARAVVGAWGEEAGGFFRAGAAYVFELNGANGAWEEVARLTASDADAVDRFGHSVSVSGAAALVGAPEGGTPGTTPTGAAYLFELNPVSGMWEEVAKLTASDADAGERFGWSLSLSGSTAIVGAPYEDTGVDRAGAAYVFELNPVSGMWEEVAKLTSSDAQELGLFGCCVSVSGMTAVVGARGEDAGGVFGAGVAYVFELNPVSGMWEEVAKLTASDAEELDYFGHSVSLSGTTAVVGAPYEDTGGDIAGAAYVFELNPVSGMWEEVAKLTASDPGERDLFGISVSVSGTTAVVGAPYEDTGVDRAGAAYVFELNPTNGAWEEVAKLTASDAEANDHFGRSVSTSETNAFVGALSEDGVDDLNYNSGAAYIYELSR
jgi:hypothetical protein